ncbi:MAG: CehA/McbA family metallohydrolase [Clostridia bacterium]|nr:CehA/McbA family metallohydrolase [Clostridia bacterium]MBO7177870.1 CehA/McbA family metallohydrolase [Clostridia bacterium]
MNKFKFELHTHTIHSDGKFTPKELVESAKRRGYYGIAVTDHNTATACKEAVEWGKTYGVLVIPGIEWTTFYGHIVVLGGNSNVDWRTITKENVVEKIKEAKADGDIVGLAHPYRVGYPVCTGGRNEFPREIFEVIDFYEVISGEIDDPTNLRSIKEYYEINEKYGVSATYGRDWHADKDEEGSRYGATLILSEKSNLKVKDVLEHIKAGDTMIVGRDDDINLLEE